MAQDFSTQATVAELSRLDSEKERGKNIQKRAARAVSPSVTETGDGSINAAGINSNAVGALSADNGDGVPVARVVDFDFITVGLLDIDELAIEFLAVEGDLDGLVRNRAAVEDGTLSSDLLLVDLLDSRESKSLTNAVLVSGVDLTGRRIRNVDILKVVIHSHEDVGKGTVGDVHKVGLLSPTDLSRTVVGIGLLVGGVAGVLAPGSDGDETEGEVGIRGSLEGGEVLSPGGDHSREAASVAGLLLVVTNVPLVGLTLVPDGTLDGGADEGMEHAVPEGGRMLVGTHEALVEEVVLGVGSGVHGLLLRALDVVDIGLTPSLDGGATPRGSDETNGKVDLLVEVETVVPAGGAEEAPVVSISSESGGVGSGPRKLNDIRGNIIEALVILLVVGNTEDTDVLVLEGLLVGLVVVEAHSDGHLHVGLTGAEPDITEEDILVVVALVVLLGGDAELVLDSVGISGGKKGSPLTIGLNGGADGLAVEGDSDVVVRIGLTVDGSVVGGSLGGMTGRIRKVYLKNHVATNGRTDDEVCQDRNQKAEEE